MGVREPRVYLGSIWKFMNTHKPDPPSTLSPEPNHSPYSERQKAEHGRVLIQSSGKGSFNAGGPSISFTIHARATRFPIPKLGS